MGMRFIGIEGNRDCYSPQQVSSCTVGEFIEYLSNYDEDMPLYLVNDNGYTYGSLGEYDISEHYINDDGDLDGEEDEAVDENLSKHRLHIEESNSNEFYKSHMHESHRVHKNKLCIKRTHKHPKLMK